MFTQEQELKIWLTGVRFLGKKMHMPNEKGEITEFAQKQAAKYLCDFGDIFLKETKKRFTNNCDSTLDS